MAPPRGNRNQKAEGQSIRKRKADSEPLINMRSTGENEKLEKALGEIKENGSSLEEYGVVYSQLGPPSPDPRLLLKLPKCPRPSKMISWTRQDYAQYDDFLLSKWNHYGFFSAHDHAYVSIRDPDSALVIVARSIYNFRARLGWSKLIHHLAF